jgi:hypothetical protein
MIFEKINLTPHQNWGKPLANGLKNLKTLQKKPKHKNLSKTAITVKQKTS